MWSERRGEESRKTAGFRVDPQTNAGETPDSYFRELWRGHHRRTLAFRSIPAGSMAVMGASKYSRV